MQDFISLSLASIVSLLPISNPLSTTPIFVSLTKGMSQEETDRTAKRTCLYVFGILVTFFLAGRLIMSFFGISIPGLRIAGGLLIMRMALSMLNASDEEAEPVKRRNKGDIAFIPLAMPSLSGPGTIAATIGLASKVDSPMEYPAVVVGIFILAFSSYYALRSAHYITKYLGVQGMQVLSNVMGFLILCIGVQFLVDGVVEVAKTL